MNATPMIRSIIGHDSVDIEIEHCDATLLNWWRNNRQLTGTKEGCAEGDCGACTLVLGEVIDGQLLYRPVNSCITLLPMIDGKHLLSVEHLAQSNAYAVQRTFADCHASQCGFCTPGFIMSLYCALLNGESAERANIDDIFSGNLCRCTGYGPIIEAARSVLHENNYQDDWQEQRQLLMRWAAEHTSLNILAQSNKDNRTTRFIAPTNLDQLVQAKAEYPEAVVVAGATDVGLWITKALREYDCFISTSRVTELQRVDLTDQSVTIGAAVSYQRAADALVTLVPASASLLRRIASRQIRSSGTIGGNIANGSPIGDMPPALIVLGSKLVLRSIRGSRELSLEDYFIDYGKQDIAADEVLEKVIVPTPAKESYIAFHKLAKRFDQDISAALLAVALRVENNLVVSVRIACGGMAAIPQRAKATEQALLGKPWQEESVEQACICLAEDFQPMTDMRASAEYRLLAVQNMLRLVYIQSTTDEYIDCEMLEPIHAAD